MSYKKTEIQVLPVVDLCKESAFFCFCGRCNPVGSWFKLKQLVVSVPGGVRPLRIGFSSERFCWLLRPPGTEIKTPMISWPIIIDGPIFWASDITEKARNHGRFFSHNTWSSIFPDFFSRHLSVSFFSQFVFAGRFCMRTSMSSIYRKHSTALRILPCTKAAKQVYTCRSERDKAMSRQSWRQLTCRAFTAWCVLKTNGEDTPHRSFSPSFLFRTCMRRPGSYPGAWSSRHLQVASFNLKSWTSLSASSAFCCILTCDSWASVAGCRSRPCSEAPCITYNRTNGNSLEQYFGTSVRRLYIAQKETNGNTAIHQYNAYQVYTW